MRLVSALDTERDTQVLNHSLIVVGSRLGDVSWLTDTRYCSCNKRPDLHLPHIVESAEGGVKALRQARRLPRSAGQPFCSILAKIAGHHEVS